MAAVFFLAGLKAQDFRPFWICGQLSGVAHSSSPSWSSLASAGLPACQSSSHAEKLTISVSVRGMYPSVAERLELAGPELASSSVGVCNTEGRSWDGSRVMAGGSRLFFSFSVVSFSASSFLAGFDLLLIFSGLVLPRGGLSSISCGLLGRSAHRNRFHLTHLSTRLHVLELDHASLGSPDECLLRLLANEAVVDRVEQLAQHLVVERGAVQQSLQLRE